MDTILMYKMMNLEEINLSALMIKHMRYVRQSSKHALPYGTVIAYMLRNEGIPKSSPSEMMGKFMDAGTLNKMNLTFDPITSDWLRDAPQAAETSKPAKRAKPTVVKKAVVSDSESTEGTQDSSPSASEGSSAESDHLSDQLESLSGKVDGLTAGLKKLEEKVDKAVKLMSKSFEKVLSKLKKKKKH